MKNWKDKVLGIFAGIGVMSLLMASNLQEPKVNYGTPESHVWELHTPEQGRVYSINKVTGEVRDFWTSPPVYLDDKGNFIPLNERRKLVTGELIPAYMNGTYRVMTSKEEKPIKTKNN